MAPSSPGRYRNGSRRNLARPGSDEAMFCVAVIARGVGESIRTYPVERLNPTAPYAASL